MKNEAVKEYGLILGASSGFGAAIARELARRGVNIIGIHLDRGAMMPAVEELKQEISDLGVEARFFNVNAADDERRSEVISTLKGGDSDEGPLTVSVLVHSLAFGTLRPLAPGEGEKGVTRSQLEMTLDVMANSLVYWTQDLLSAELMRNGSRIIALTSSGSRHVLPYYGPVSAAKSALESYCRQLAFELGDREISVNAIEAGVTDTQALRKIPGTEHLISNASSRNPRKRLTTPEDVASVVGMLCSEGAGWINGTSLRVDGGESIVELDWREEK